MATNTFSATAFARLIRAGDSKRFEINLKTDRKAIIEAAVAESAAGPVLKPFFKTTLRGKVCISHSRYNDHLVLRAAAQEMQRRLRLKLPNRDRIVRGVIESLLDATPMCILRRDISSFYESIPVEPLKERIIYDTGSSRRLRDVSKLYFDQHCSSPHGIPRGVGLSAILAELAMHDFDQSVREIGGVYRYFRFSDDIVIFAFLAPSEISNQISDLLPPSMQFNPQKSFDLHFKEVDKKKSRIATFEYLGYQFSASDFCGQRDGRRVDVSISKQKINRLKTRVILSLREYKKTKNYPLLRDRLRFVASNYRVRRSGLSQIGASTHIRSGIFYNYRQCGIYSASNRGPQIEESPCIELRQLDGFFHGLLKSSKSEFANVLKTNIQAKEFGQLTRISFLSGYKKRMTVRLRPDRVSDIKRVWRNA